MKITPQQEAVNKIRGYLGTLDLYRRASMKAHNRLIPSVYALAVQFEDTVNTIQLDYAQSPEVARYYNKFQDYLEQYKLLE